MFNDQYSHDVHSYDVEHTNVQTKKNKFRSIVCVEHIIGNRVVSRMQDIDDILSGACMTGFIWLHRSDDV